MRGPLRIAFLGGSLPALGGGGIDVQKERTAAALRELGHEVFRVEAAPAGQEFDVLHAFGTEPQVWHALSHWRLNQSPLVVTPVLVIEEGRERRALWVSARLPGLMTSGRMKISILERADAIVAGTAHERDLAVQLFKAAPERFSVIGNAASPVEAAMPADAAQLPSEPYVLMLGNISARKRQLEVVEALGNQHKLVAIGAFEGSSAERAKWERAVDRNLALWLGEIRDRAHVTAVQERAQALVLLSRAEVQSLAVMETLALGVPVILSSIPPHRELRDSYPDHVELVDGPHDIPAALGRLQNRPRSDAPSVLTWADVAARLEGIYLGLTAAGDQA